MRADTLMKYCNVAEVTLIETGSGSDGKLGYWFSDRGYNRVFRTEDEIYAAIDRRSYALFQTEVVVA